MNCPLRIAPRNCGGCPFGKEGLCDYPHATAATTRPLPAEEVVAADLRSRFVKARGLAREKREFCDLPRRADGLVLRMLDTMAPIYVQLKTREEARWN